MQQIGFSMINSEGAEIQHWGNTIGVMTSPHRVVWPDGAIREGIVTEPVAYGDWRIVPRMAIRGAEYGAAFDGEKVVVTVPVAVNEIKFEAQKRIMTLVGATDIQSCIIKQLNALMRGTELANEKHSRPLTAEEEYEAAVLIGLAHQIKVIRAKSNDLELSLPSDYTDDRHW